VRKNCTIGMRKKSICHAKSPLLNPWLSWNKTYTVKPGDIKLKSLVNFFLLTKLSNHGINHMIDSKNLTIAKIALLKKFTKARFDWIWIVISILFIPSCQCLENFLFCLNFSDKFGKLFQFQSNLTAQNTKWSLNLSISSFKRG